MLDSYQQLLSKDEFIQFLLYENDEKQKTGLPSSDNQGGRPPKPDDEKSEKTLRNIESSG